MHRYFAVKVVSDYGCNRYRLIGLAKEEDKTPKFQTGKLPDYVIIYTDDEYLWTSIVEITVSPLTGNLQTNINGLLVE
jgi:hypothetical protein